MPRHTLRRPVATVLAALAVAAGTAGAAQLTHPGADRPTPCSRDGVHEGADTVREALPRLPVAAASSGCAASGALPDKPEDRLSVVDKARIVVLMAGGDTRGSEVAAKYQVSEDQVDAWKGQLLQGDWFRLLPASGALR
ncbi:helix-turn-helix domain-containing protein [Actinacidiphila glaucinigra]|uniref:helix-turn-helix domain-containing protein n=1 Tax=Actinacidiphila glaucinigra TaxID=235986 RepID=UPI0033A96652